jgi:hypothetical protein
MTFGAGSTAFGLGVNRRGIADISALDDEVSGDSSPRSCEVMGAGVDAPLVKSSSSSPNDNNPLAAFFFFFFGGSSREPFCGVNALHFAN